MDRIRLFILSLIVATAAPIASATNIPLFNTGVDTSGIVLASLAQDVHFSATRPAGSGVPIAFRSATYLNNTATAGWDTIVPTLGAAQDQTVGFFTYTEAFNTTVGGTYRFSGQWATDNCGQIGLGAANTPVTGTGTTIGNPSSATACGLFFGFTSATAFSFDAALAVGANSLDFLVLNTGGPEGLFVDSLTAVCISGACLGANAVPEPVTAALVGVGLFGAALARRKAGLPRRVLRMAGD